MSSERQGQVGDLRRKSKEELCELLLRQEKLLSNKRFLQTLPDKGKKISDFAERVHLAIAHHEEEERNPGMLSSVRTELESKYRKAFTLQQHGMHDEPRTSHQNKLGDDGACGVVMETETSPVSCNMQETTAANRQQEHFVSRTAEAEAGASLNSDGTKGSDLVEAMERVRLSDHTSCTESSIPSKDTLNSAATENFFIGKQPPKKPHYVEVLENTEGNAATRKHKFKPNQLPPRTDNSPSGSSSPSRHPPGGSSPLSAEARKERDRKHLDDITSARLPLLHHSPVQLLSLDESVALLREQAKKQQELQAKLAAQKLSEGARIGMGSYSPDGGPMPAYREVHDDSSEED